MGESKLANIIYVVTHIDPYIDGLNGGVLLMKLLNKKIISKPFVVL